jgi:hypothetical protein
MGIKTDIVISLQGKARNEMTRGNVPVETMRDDLDGLVFDAEVIGAARELDDNSDPAGAPHPRCGAPKGCACVHGLGHNPDHRAGREIVGPHSGP